MPIALKLELLFKKFTLLVIFTLPLFYLAAFNEQGSPLLNNYSSTDYRANNQNYAITEDHRGILYAANFDGVLEFDGISWNLIRLPHNKPATSVASDNENVIFVGSYSEFGYLKPNDKGKLIYESLLHLFPEKEKRFSDILNIHTSKHGVFFNSKNKLYHLSDSTIRHWNISESGNVFEVDNNIFLFDKKPGKGLMYFDGKDFKKNKTENSLSEYSIFTMLPYSDKKILFGCSENGFFLISDIFDTSQKKHPEIKALENQDVLHALADDTINSGLKLKNGNYAFGTLSDGTYIMNKKGELINIINENAGLQNNTVNYIYENSDQILWMGLNNGISSANINYPITFWDKTSGFDGPISDIIRFKNEIYISTWKGVYKLSKDTIKGKIPKPNKQFEKINNIPGNAWSFLVLKDNNHNDDKLLVATTDGIYSIDNNYARRIFEDSFFTMKRSNYNPEIIICGGIKGLKILHYNKEKKLLKPIKYLNELKDYEIYEIYEGHSAKFWLANIDGGILFLKFNNLDTFLKNDENILYDFYHFEQKHGIPKNLSLRPLEINGLPVFLSHNSIYIFKNDDSDNINNGKFVPVSDILNRYLERKFSFSKIKIDKSGNCYLQLLSKIYRERRLFFLKDFKKLNLTDFRLLPIWQTAINAIMVENQKGSAWFGGDDTLFKLELNSLDYEQGKTNPYIRSIRVNNKRIYYGANKKNDFSIFHAEKMNDSINNITPNLYKYTKNSFNFNYTLPSLFNPAANLYSVYLKNHDKEWSKWSYETTKTYNNLSPGDYKFLIKGKDALGNESFIAGFAFKILNPWYKTQTAYIIYFFLIIIIIYLIIRITNRQLVKTKANLENIVEERTSEIANQQKKLEIEKEKSDKLLRNILPYKIAQEIKVHGHVLPKYYDLATVMFMDFKDFSKTSQFINPLHLINELDKSFGFFDEVCADHNLEKIKTMGDAYMCAGGIPEPNKTNPFDAVLAALEILDFIREAGKKQWLCDLRIGIHTGELIAGVVGKNKFTYDIWGETVNTASRLEDKGEANKINISGQTYNIIKDYFVCSYRGKLPAKHSDEYQMYFVNRIKKEYSADSSGKKPNKKLIDIILNMK